MFVGIFFVFYCLEDGCRVCWELLLYVFCFWEGLEIIESCGDFEEICCVIVKGNMINILDLLVFFIFVIIYLN